MIEKEERLEALKGLIEEDKYPLVGVVTVGGRLLYCCCIPPEGHDPTQFLHDFADTEGNRYTCFYDNGGKAPLAIDGQMLWFTAKEVGIFGV